MNGRERCLLGIVLGADTMTAALLADVFSEKWIGIGFRLRIENANVKGIPLDVDELADPTRRCAVVGCLDFHTAVQMHDAFAVLVIAKWLDRQRQQERLFFSKHGGDLSFRRAMNTGVGPTRLPVIQISLGLL